MLLPKLDNHNILHNEHKASQSWNMYTMLFNSTYHEPFYSWNEKRWAWRLQVTYCAEVMTRVLWQPIVCAEAGEISDDGYEMVLHWVYIPKIVSIWSKGGHQLQVHIPKQDQPQTSSEWWVRSWLIGFYYKWHRHASTWALQYPLLKQC